MSHWQARPKVSLLLPTTIVYHVFRLIKQPNETLFHPLSMHNRLRYDSYLAKLNTGCAVNDLAY